MDCDGGVLGSVMSGALGDDAEVLNVVLSNLGLAMWGMYRWSSQRRISVTSTPPGYRRTTELSDTTIAIAPVDPEIDAAAMCLLPSPRGCWCWERVASKWRQAESTVPSPPMTKPPSSWASSLTVSRRSGWWWIVGPGDVPPGGRV